MRADSSLHPFAVAVTPKTAPATTTPATRTQGATFWHVKNLRFIGVFVFCGIIPRVEQGYGAACRRRRGGQAAPTAARQSGTVRRGRPTAQDARQWPIRPQRVRSHGRSQKARNGLSRGLRRQQPKGGRIVKGVAHRRVYGLRKRPYVPPVDNSSRSDAKGRRVTTRKRRRAGRWPTCLRRWRGCVVDGRGATG